MPAAQNGIPHSQLLNKGSITVGIKPLTFKGKIFIKNWNTVKHQEIILAGQSSLRKQAIFSWRILRSRRRILRSPMPTEHPANGHALFKRQFC